MNYNEIEKCIINCKKPILLLSLYSKKYKDDELYYIIRFFMKYHFKIFMKNNILNIININNKESIKIILKLNKIISNKLKIMEKIKNIKYNKILSILDINEQIINLEIIIDIFKAHFDCSIGNLYFHNKLKIALDDSEKIQNDYTMELFKRLKCIYKMFGINFFINNNIELISYDDFFEISFMGRIKYTEKLFIKINNLLVTLLDNLKLYNSQQKELYNIVNPQIVYIKINKNENENDINIDF
jgi:hypothetical protein